MSIEKIKLTKNDFDALVNEEAKKFNSTMIDIFNLRSKNIIPSNLLKNYERKYDLYESSKIDPRIYNEISNIFFDSVSSDFECIELSPINPFGLSSALTLTNQNNVLSSVRNSEVISDSSISMALECAYRIRKMNVKNVNLASSTRILRTQNYGTGKKTHWSQHFRACSLVSSFRNNGNNMFKILELQLNNWLNVVENLKENLNIEQINLNFCFIPLVKEIYKFYNVDENLILSHTVNPNYDVFQRYNISLPNIVNNESRIDALNAEKSYLISINNTYKFFNNNIIEPLKSKHKNVKFNLQLNRKSGLTYYDDICYEIEVIFKDGKSLVLIDGGVNDWIGKILSDNKEKCVTSGMGLEYLGKVYKRKL